MAHTNPVAMNNQDLDDRSSIAKGWSRASEIMAACIMMVLPALIGYWLDNWLETGQLFLIVGFFLGMIAAFYQLMKIVKSMDRKSKSIGTDEKESENGN